MQTFQGGYRHRADGSSDDNGGRSSPTVGASDQRRRTVTSAF
ncbi:hypothetical protein [Halorussus sp. MSC15.2]|nr:hypothetical protein [Halorussus sp. MSC15.2]